MSLRKKIALIGSGSIGGNLAFLCGLKELGDIVLFDIMEGIPQGKSLDISQALAIEGCNANIKGSNDYKDIQDADVVIITAGVPRKPGMSREDLLAVNVKVIDEVAKAVKQYAPHAFVIVITNPLDAVVTRFQQSSGLPHHKVVGMAGVLDSARFRSFLSQELNISSEKIATFFIGAHGSTMVPVISASTVAGIPLTSLIKTGMLTQDKLTAMIERTRNGGAEIVALLKTGSAFYAPASAAVTMAESYLKNQRQVFPCSAYVNGKYGLNGLYVGVPIVIGGKGVEKIIEIPLTHEESDAFKLSIASITDLLNDMKKI